MKHPGGIPVPKSSLWFPDEDVEIHQVPLKAAPGDSRWKLWELDKLSPAKFYAAGQTSAATGW